jgi:hypothetical protein
MASGRSLITGIELNLFQYISFISRIRSAYKWPSDPFFIPKLRFIIRKFIFSRKITIFTQLLVHILLTTREPYAAIIEMA